MRYESARLYREMIDDGVDPNRGLAPVFAAMIVCGIATIALMFVAVVTVLGWWGGLRVSALFPF